MKNKNVFIGNLDFEITEEEIKTLLSGYGTVVSIKMFKKKGYAFVEMGDEIEAAAAVSKLNGVMYKNREIRINLKLKEGKARSISVRKYKERGESLARERSGEAPDTRSRSEKYRDSMKAESKDRGRQPGLSHGTSKGGYRPKERPAGFEEKPAGKNRKGSQGPSETEKVRQATEKPSFSQDEPSGYYSKINSGSPGKKSSADRSDKKGLSGNSGKKRQSKSSGSKSRGRTGDRD